MNYETYKQEAIKRLPPQSQNNSRSILRNWIEKAEQMFKRTPSSIAAHRIEDLTGWPVDFDDRDWGTGPRGEKE